MNISKVATIATLALLTAACSGPCKTRNLCKNRVVVSDAAVAQTANSGEGVLFDFDSATLTAAGEKALAPYAEYMKQNPDKTAQIAGYTDSTGPDEYNMDLSQRRANSAKAYLVKNGVEAKRLTAKGYGETNFVADNETAQGRAQNRRIEIEFK